MAKSNITKLALYIFIGCMSSSILTLMINKIQYDMEPSNQSVSTLKLVTMVKLSIIPSIFNLIIWGGLIWFIIHSSTFKCGTGTGSILSSELLKE